MAFLLRCPDCGERNVHDFRFGGEVVVRPHPEAPAEELTQYFYYRKNESGLQQEWWYHKYGCRKWFLAVRDTRTNAVLSTLWPEIPAG